MKVIMIIVAVALTTLTYFQLLESERQDFETSVCSLCTSCCFWVTLILIL